MICAMLLWAGLANAGTTAESVQASREALVENDVERALSLLAQARMSIVHEGQVLDAATISQLIYLEGLAPRLLGAERDRDVDKWRNALVVYPGLQWDRELLDDKALRGFFEALRAEVGQRPPINTQVPKERGLLKAYVNGVEHTHLQAVRQGQHVAQAECPDGSIHGAWSNFESDFDWLALCPDGVDLTVATPQQEVDEFALDDEDPRAGPSPLAWVPPAVVPAKTKPVRAQRDGPILDKRTLWIGAATGAAVSGITYVAALAARGKYDDLSADGLNTPSELAKQRKRTNGLVYTSAIFATAGAGLGVAATMSGEF